MSAWEGLNPPYATIVADPPWHYDRYVTAPRNANNAQRLGPVKVAKSPYSSMSVDEIAALPVAELAAPDAWLWLWTTTRYLPFAFVVAGAWGFTYRQMLVWRKTGNPSPFGGTVAPAYAEFLFLCSTGAPAVSGRISSPVIEAPKPNSHSLKPAVFLDIVEATTPGPYCELFARRQRLGWDSWGKGYEVAS